MFIPLALVKKKTSEGVPDSKRQKKKTFRGAFFCNGGVSGTGIDVTLDRGFVNGLEPVVGGVNISGDAKGDNQPHIKGAETYDAYNRAYVCIKIAVDASSGVMTAKASGVNENNLGVEIRTNFHSSERSILYHPVAIVHKELGVQQIAYHDFMHISIKQNGILRHLMFAA